MNYKKRNKKEARRKANKAKAIEQRELVIQRAKAKEVKAEAKREAYLKTPEGQEELKRFHESPVGKSMLNTVAAIMCIHAY